MAYPFKGIYSIIKSSEGMIHATPWMLLFENYMLIESSQSQKSILHNPIKYEVYRISTFIVTESR